MNKNIKFLTLIILFSTGLSAFAQTTAALDEKFGFQNFRFNTPLSTYSNFNPSKVAENQYLLKNISAVKIGNYEVESMELFFKNDKLIKVKVTMDDQDRQKNENIFNALIKNYGRYTYHRSTSGYTYSSEMVWKGKVVNLVYSFTSFKDGDKFSTKIYLTYSYVAEEIEVDLSKFL